MREIIRRFEQLLWEEDAPTKDSALELYQALEPADACETWYWKDIDYFDQTRSFWCAKKHFDRILSILKGFGKSRLAEDCAYTKKMIGALNYWLVNDFENRAIELTMELAATWTDRFNPPADYVEKAGDLP